MAGFQAKISLICSLLLVYPEVDLLLWMDFEGKILFSLHLLLMFKKNIKINKLPSGPHLPPPSPITFSIRHRPLPRSLPFDLLSSFLFIFSPFLSTPHSSAPAPFSSCLLLVPRHWPSPGTRPSLAVGTLPYPSIGPLRPFIYWAPFDLRLAERRAFVRPSRTEQRPFVRRRLSFDLFGQTKGLYLAKHDRTEALFDRTVSKGKPVLKKKALGSGEEMGLKGKRTVLERGGDEGSIGEREGRREGRRQGRGCGEKKGRVV